MSSPDRSVTLTDADVLRILLPAWAGAFGSTPIAISELFRHVVLRELLVGRCSTESTHWNPRKLAKCFKRNVGVIVDVPFSGGTPSATTNLEVRSYVIERGELDSGRRTWAIYRVIKATITR